MALSCHTFPRSSEKESLEALSRGYVRGSRLLFGSMFFFVVWWFVAGFGAPAALTWGTGITALACLAANFLFVDIPEMGHNKRFRHARKVNEAWNVPASRNTPPIFFSDGPNRALAVAGPPVFQEAVGRILEEVSEKAPHRLDEVMMIGRAFYSDSEYDRKAFVGRSDGMFTLDGSDYYYLRKVFLHEVGHVLMGTRKQDNSEGAANDYCNRVSAELDR